MRVLSPNSFDFFFYKVDSIVYCPKEFCFGDKHMEENCTIIRVWFCQKDGGVGVGHATLETPNEYLSVWPSKRSKAKTNSGMLFEHRPGVSFVACHQDDASLEERQPEYFCPLYSLNVSKMDAKIRDIKTETDQWSTAGNTWFGNWTFGTSRSCSGAVREALIAGEMHLLARAGMLTNLMTSPHNILTWTRDAKEAELEKYPITKEYDNARGYKFDPHYEVHRMTIIQQFRH